MSRVCVLPLTAVFLLLSSRAALALDMEFYTYNGFGPVSQAFQRLGLIFSDSNYLGLFFTVTVLGILSAAVAFYVRSVTGTKIVPLAWAWPVLLGVCVYLAAFVPKGNVTVYDPVLNRMQTFSNIPDAIVLITGVQNKIERALVDIIDTAGTPGAKYQEAAGGIGFSVLNQALTAPMKNAWAEMSMASYIEDCVVYELSLPDSRILPEDLLYGTTNFLTELGNATRPTIFTTYYDAAHPGGQSLTCTDAWTNLQAIYSNAASFNGAVLSACGASLFDPGSAAEVAQCRALISGTLSQVTGNSVTPENFVSQGNISRLLYTVLDQADLQTAMAVKANQRIATNAFGIGTTLNEWLPIIRALLIAISISLVPLLTVFLPTPMFSKALLAMFGFFFLTTTWGICDAFLHQAAMDYASDAFEEIRQSGLGLHACLNFPEVSSKTLAMFGMFRSSGLMLTGFLSMLLFRFGGHAMVAMAGNLQGAVQGAGGEAGRMATPEGGIMAREGLINAASAEGWMNTNSFSAMTAGRELGRQSETARVDGFARQHAAASKAGQTSAVSSAEFLRETHSGGKIYNDAGAHSISAGAGGRVGLAETRSAADGFSTGSTMGADGVARVSMAGSAGKAELTRKGDGETTLNKAEVANLDGIRFTQAIQRQNAREAAHSFATHDQIRELNSRAESHSDTSAEARAYREEQSRNLSNVFAQRVNSGEAWQHVNNDEIRKTLNGSIGIRTTANGGFEIFGNGFKASATASGDYQISGIGSDGKSFSRALSKEDSKAINESLSTMQSEALSRTLQNSDARAWAHSVAEDVGAGEARSYLEKMNQVESRGAQFGIDAQTEFVHDYARERFGRVNEQTVGWSLNELNRMTQTTGGRELLSQRVNRFVDSRFDSAGADLDQARGEAAAAYSGLKKGDLAAEVKNHTAGADFSAPRAGRIEQPEKPSMHLEKGKVEEGITNGRARMMEPQNHFNEAIGLGVFNKSHKLTTEGLDDRSASRGKEKGGRRRGGKGRK